MFYVREGIPSKLINSKKFPVVCFSFEKKLRKNIWSISCSYNQCKKKIKGASHSTELKRFISEYKKPVS